jgi:hypothetical protein
LEGWGEAEELQRLVERNVFASQPLPASTDKNHREKKKERHSIQTILFFSTQ